MDEIWFNDPKILLDRITEFVPMPEMSFNEKLNSIVRFSFISSFFLIMYNKNIYTLLFPIFVIGITIFLGRRYSGKKDFSIMFDNDQGDYKQCSLPTKDNPYMNLIATDYDNVNKPVACDINNPQVKKMIKNYDFENLQSRGDIYNSQERGNRFYTLPSTTIGQEEREDFINFCYKLNNKTCKEEPSRCNPQEDIRYNRSTII